MKTKDYVLEQTLIVQEQQPSIRKCIQCNSEMPEHKFKFCGDRCAADYHRKAATLRTRKKNLHQRTICIYGRAERVNTKLEQAYKAMTLNMHAYRNAKLARDVSVELERLLQNIELLSGQMKTLTKDYRHFIAESEMWE